MRIDISAKNYFVREKLKELIEKKCLRLEKFFDNEVSCKVVCSAKDKQYKMEISLRSAGNFVRGEVTSDNMFANLDLCLARIEKQIVKYSDKLLSQKRQTVIPNLDFFDEEDVAKFEKPKIVKTKTYDLVPLNLEDAIEQMDLIGNNFFVFLNRTTNEVNVLYKREDGNLGLIETKI